MNLDAPGTGRRRRALKHVPMYILLSTVGAVFFAPIAYLFIASFAPNDQVLGGVGSINLLDLSFDNYVRVFTYFNNDASGHLLQFIAVSVIVTTIVVTGGIVVNSLAGYALARLRWRGRNAVLLGVTILTIVPFEAVAVPLYAMLNSERNTIYVQALPFIANAFSIFLFYTFFLDLPMEVEEAARLDGASVLRTFFSVVIPMTRPAFATVAIITFLGQWGSYLWPVLMVSSPEVRPLSVQLGVFQAAQRPEWGSVFALGVIFVLPVLAMFLAFQRWFVASIASTGIKG